jgi:hypothetical protein
VDWQTSESFEGAVGRAVIVTFARYVETLQNSLTPELNRRGTELSTIWFQEDGGNDHTARASMEFVRQIIPEHVVSVRGKLP